MKITRFLSSLLLACILVACSAKPEPFDYGKDNCYTCKMTVIDPKFGAEVITAKGKVFKFDDVICLQHFLSSGEVKAADIKQQVVINFEKGNEFLELGNAFFVKSEAVKSPMGSQAAAFADKASAEKFNATVNGSLLTWKELSGKLQ